jgi:hypothetical protein
VATNANGSDTETKNSYIIVGGTSPGEAPCDTLNYPLPGTMVLYSVRYQSGVYGYVSGNNGYSDNAKANFFMPSAPYVKLTGAWLKFGRATKRSGVDSKICFAVWDNSGTSSTPGATPIATDTVMLSTLVSQANGHQMTYIEFPTPVDITGPFYLGVILPDQIGDTLALLTNKNGETVPASAWEQWQNGLWINYADSTSWGYNLAHAIFPVMCKADLSVEDMGDGPYLLIYPNPASNVVNIDFGPIAYDKVDIRLFNLMGALVGTKHYNGSAITNLRMDIDGLPSGIYTMQISINENNLTRKISIIR